MEINASSTCKYLKDKRRKSAPDLRQRCCDLRLIALSSDDAKVLTALYRAYTYGGKIVIECEDLKVSAELNGMFEPRQPIASQQQSGESAVSNVAAGGKG